MTSMKKIVFGGIYIIAGLLAVFVLQAYDIGFGRHDFDFLISLPILSVVTGMVVSIKGLCEKSEEEE